MRVQLDTVPDFVILNKFGKTEAEGGGFRDIIADVIMASVPLLIAVPWRNIESWRAFVGDACAEVVLDGHQQGDLIRLLGFDLPFDQPEDQKGLR